MKVETHKFIKEPKVGNICKIYEDQKSHYTGMIEEVKYDESIRNGKIINRQIIVVREVPPLPDNKLHEYDYIIPNTNVKKLQ